MSNNSSPIWHPFTQHAIAPESIQIDRASGAHLYPKSGEKIIDAISSWWVITHGHAHPKIVKKVQDQAEKCDQIIFAGFTHEPAEELGQRLVDMTGPSLEHVFFSDSGSTAVEVAMKMAIGFWEHTGKSRQKIIALDGGYHGDTFGTMSAGGRCIYNKLYEPYLFDVLHAPFPEKGKEDKIIQYLKEILEQHKNDVAAFVFEPLIQGAGGMRIFSPQALKEMISLCKAHGVLLIADEVMTGFGRTGTMFACEQAGFVPDILCLSKGLTGGFLPMGATLCTNEIYKAFYHNDRAKMFYHSSSFTGNPLACAAANASLQIWQDEPVLRQIEELAAHHKKAIPSFESRGDIENVRQLGTILAMDIKVDGAAGYLSDIQPRLYESFLLQGVLLRPLGNTVYILPPYCITKQDLDKVYDAIRITLDRLGHEREQRRA